MTDAEKRLADVEARVKKAQALVEKTGEAWKAALELTKGLENQLREKNERILQLEKDADFGRRFRELLAEYGHIGSAPPTSTGATGIEVTDPVATIHVRNPEEPVKADTSTVMGQIAKAVHEGVFTSGTNPSRMKSLLREHFGKDWDKNEIQKVLDELTAPPYRLVTHSVGKDGTHWYSLRKTAKERVVKE